MGKILKYWPNDEILLALQNLPSEPVLTSKLVNVYNKQKLICCRSLITKRFGSIKNACDLAGIKCGCLYDKEHQQHMSNLNIKYTKETLSKLLIEKSKDYPVLTPTKLIMNINKDNNVDIRNVIKKFYGTWENALIQNNIPYIDYHWNKERIINTLTELNNKFGPLCKWDVNQFAIKGYICRVKTIKDIMGCSFDNIAKKCGFIFINSVDKGHRVNSIIGKNEPQVLDRVEKDNNIKLIRQFRIKTNIGLFIVDGYDEKNNVVYEYDEIYHKKFKDEDMIRDNAIVDELNCEIIRIKAYG